MTTDEKITALIVDAVKGKTGILICPADKADDILRRAKQLKGYHLAEDTLVCIYRTKHGIVVEPGP